MIIPKPITVSDPEASAREAVALLETIWKIHSPIVMQDGEDFLVVNKYGHLFRFVREKRS